MLKATSPVEAIRLKLSMLRLPLVIVLSGVVLAIVQYVLLAEHQRDEIASEFQAIADRLPEQVAERMKVYEYGLISALVPWLRRAESKELRAVSFMSSAKP